MTTNDIDFVPRIAEQIHTDLPESDAVFAERPKLFPSGCLMLEGDDQKPCGYKISHPIRSNHPPALDTLLGEIPSDADQYYIHDVAILPAVRGKGLCCQGCQSAARGRQDLPNDMLDLGLWYSEILGSLRLRGHGYRRGSFEQAEKLWR